VGHGSCLSLRNPFIDGCSATPVAQAIDGAQVNHDQGRRTIMANGTIRVWAMP
jgi:hypothetical protein